VDSYLNDAGDVDGARSSCESADLKKEEEKDQEEKASSMPELPEGEKKKKMSALTCIFGAPELP